jgi:hypothetical protein
MAKDRLAELEAQVAKMLELMRTNGWTIETPVEPDVEAEA